MCPPLWFEYGWAIVRIRRPLARSATFASFETRYSLIAVAPDSVGEVHVELAVRLVRSGGRRDRGGPARRPSRPTLRRSRKGVASRLPPEMIRILPVCSTTNRRPDASPAWVTSTGLDSPETTGASDVAATAWGRPLAPASPGLSAAVVGAAMVRSRSDAAAREAQRRPAGRTVMRLWSTRTPMAGKPTFVPRSAPAVRVEQEEGPLRPGRASRRPPAGKPLIQRDGVRTTRVDPIARGRHGPYAPTPSRCESRPAWGSHR